MVELSPAGRIKKQELGCQGVLVYGPYLALRVGRSFGAGGPEEGLLPGNRCKGARAGCIDTESSREQREGFGKGKEQAYGMLVIR
jgi:hypothetical protein